MVKKTIKKKKSYFEAQKNALATSFRNIIKKDFLKSAFFDLILLITIIVVINGSASYINLHNQADIATVSSFQLSQSDVNFPSPDSDSVAEALERIIISSSIIFFIAALILLAAISWFSGSAWLVWKGRKCSWRYIWRFFLMNLMWFILLVAVLLLIITALRDTAVVIMFIMYLLFISYTDQVMRATYEEKKTIIQNFKCFFRLARKIHWFAPYLFFSVVLLTLALYLLSFLLESQTFLVVGALIFTTIILGWSRNYINGIVNEI